MLVRDQAQACFSIKEQPGQRENRRAASALRDYLELGPCRNLETLLERYRTEPGAPTCRPVTLAAWSQRYDWAERAAEFDELEMVKAQKINAEQKEGPVGRGLALAGERVESLKQLYTDLQAYMCQAWPVWLADLQTAESGSPERNRAPRFNPGVIAQMRGILDDLARETGGRAVRSVTALNARLEADTSDASQLDYSLLSQTELDTLEAILQKAMPSRTGLQQPPLPGLI